MREINVVGAAVLDGTRVLAAQRSAEMYPPLKWEFPGGKVEEGETHEQALKREIYEELGMEIGVGSFVAEGIHQTDTKIIRLHVYEASIIAGNPNKSEHSALQWVEIDGLGSLDWADPDIPACKELMRRYGSSCWNYRR